MSEAETVEVELLGVARHLARRACVRIRLSGPAPLVEVVRGLAREAPALVGTVVSEEGALLGGHAFSRDGRAVIQDPAETVHPGERLLLFSTVGGG